MSAAPEARRSRRSAGALPPGEPEEFWLEGDQGDATWTISTSITADILDLKHLPRMLPQYRKRALESLRRRNIEIPAEFDRPDWINPPAPKKMRAQKTAKEPLRPATGTPSAVNVRSRSPIPLTASPARQRPQLEPKKAGSMTKHRQDSSSAVVSQKLVPAPSATSSTPVASDSDSDKPTRVVRPVAPRLTKAIRTSNLLHASARISVEVEREASRVAGLAATAVAHSAASQDQRDTHIQVEDPLSSSKHTSSSEDSSPTRNRAILNRAATPAPDSSEPEHHLSDLDDTATGPPPSSIGDISLDDMDLEPPSRHPGSAVRPPPSSRSPFGHSRTYHRSPPAAPSRTIAITEEILVGPSDEEETVALQQQPRRPAFTKVVASTPDKAKRELNDAGNEPDEDQSAGEGDGNASGTKQIADGRRRMRRTDTAQQEPPFPKPGPYHSMEYFPDVDDVHEALRAVDTHPTVAHGNHGYLFPGMTLSSVNRASVKKRSIGKNHLSEVSADPASEKSNTLLKREAASLRGIHQYAEYTDGFAIQIISRPSKFAPVHVWFSPAVLKAVDREKLLDWVWTWNEMVEDSRISTKQTNKKAASKMRETATALNGRTLELQERERILDDRERELNKREAAQGGPERSSAGIGKVSRQS